MLKGSGAPLRARRVPVPRGSWPTGGTTSTVSVRPATGDRGLRRVGPSTVVVHLAPPAFGRPPPPPVQAAGSDPRVHPSVVHHGTEAEAASPARRTGTSALEDRLAAVGGVAPARDLAPTRSGRRRLREAVQAGGIIRLGDGWYALPQSDGAIARARRLNGVLTCVSAARFYRVPDVGTDERVHISVPRQRGDRHRPGRPLDGTVVHREAGGGTVAGLAAAGMVLPVAPPAQALARALRCCPGPVAVAMVDSALRAGIVGRAEIETRLHGPGSRRARELLALSDPQSRSGIETVARLALRAAGYPVRAGVWIEGVGEVDLVVADRVVIECDGFAYHSGRKEYREDRRRDRELAALGYVTLRFTYEEIMRDATVVVRAVARILARG